jgi:PRC-barrel domain protein
MAGNAENIIHTEYSTPYRRVLAADSLSRDCVLNRMNENVGSIKDIMIDLPSGCVAYAVLSVGGFLGMGDPLFAIPWESLVVDEDRKCFILDVDKSRLHNAPGFDKSNWPDMGDTSWDHQVREYWTGNDDYGIGADRATVGRRSRRASEKSRRKRAGRSKDRKVMCFGAPRRLARSGPKSE